MRGVASGPSFVMEGMLNSTVEGSGMLSPPPSRPHLPPGISPPPFCIRFAFRPGVWHRRGLGRGEGGARWLSMASGNPPLCPLAWRGHFTLGLWVDSDSPFPPPLTTKSNESSKRAHTSGFPGFAGALPCQQPPACEQAPGFAFGWPLLSPSR